MENVRQQKQQGLGKTEVLGVSKVVEKKITKWMGILFSFLFLPGSRLLKFAKSGRRGCMGSQTACNRPP
jgi:hypothetical protein